MLHITCAAECPDNIFNIIIFLNKLKIVENTQKKTKGKYQNKTSIGPFRDSQAPSWLSGLQTDVPTEPPFIVRARESYNGQ